MLFWWDYALLSVAATYAVFGGIGSVVQSATANVMCSVPSEDAWQRDEINNCCQRHHDGVAFDATASALATAVWLCLAYGMVRWGCLPKLFSLLHQVGAMARAEAVQSLPTVAGVTYDERVQDLLLQPGMGSRLRLWVARVLAHLMWMVPLALQLVTVLRDEDAFECDNTCTTGARVSCEYVAHDSAFGHVAWALVAVALVASVRMALWLGLLQPFLFYKQVVLDTQTPLQVGRLPQNVQQDRLGGIAMNPLPRLALCLQPWLQGDGRQVLSEFWQRHAMQPTQDYLRQVVERIMPCIVYRALSCHLHEGVKTVETRTTARFAFQSKHAWLQDYIDTLDICMRTDDLQQQKLPVPRTVDEMRRVTAECTDMREFVKNLPMAKHKCWPPPWLTVANARPGEDSRVDTEFAGLLDRMRAQDADTTMGSGLGHLAARFLLIGAFAEPHLRADAIKLVRTDMSVCNTADVPWIIIILAICRPLMEFLHSWGSAKPHDWASSMRVCETSATARGAVVDV